MEAIILAGGLGKRLRGVVNDVPKPMADILGKPFLEYIMEYLKKNNVKKVILAIGYKGHVIKDYFGGDYKGISIMYSEEMEPLGTGGGIKQAIRLCENENNIIINGDTYFDVDLPEMMKQHIMTKSDLTIATKVMYDFDRYGIVVSDKDKRIIEFKEKKYYNQGNINGGVYICKKELVDEVTENSFSFEKEVLEKKYKIKKFSSFISESYFIDIGIPNDYFSFKNYIESIKINGEK